MQVMETRFSLLLSLWTDLSEILPHLLPFFYPFLSKLMIPLDLERKRIGTHNYSLGLKTPKTQSMSHMEVIIPWLLELQSFL